MANNETTKYARSKAAERRAQGLCYDCENVPAPRKTRCEACLARVNANAKASRDRKKAKHLCSVCPEPAVPGRGRCATHLEGQNEKARERGEKLLCYDCGTPVGSTSTRCSPCAARFRELAQRRRRERGEQLQCGDCGAPTEGGKKTCETCLMRKRIDWANRRAKRTAAGLCATYGGPRTEEGNKTCQKCIQRINSYAYNPDSKGKASCGGNRPRVLDRDSFKCRICGWSESNTVHHIDGSGTAAGYRSSSANNNMQNLITLCRACHYDLERFLRVTTDMSLLLQLLQRKQLE